MGSCAPSSFDVKKVAIIGAGPCGLAAAKYLIAQGSYESIVIFEQQDQVGGIWYYSHDPTTIVRVPQTDPFCSPDPPLRQGGNQAPVFPSPMYERLHANIPGSLMNYQDYPFSRDAWVFPSRETVQDYILRHGDDVRQLIRFCVKVETIGLRQENGRDKWDLEVKSTISEEAIKETFDAVVVANGHYSVPYIPAIKGIGAFHEAHPEIISHSKHYRIAKSFTNKKTIVVGNGPSGIDIARQINDECSGPVLLSVRHPTPSNKLAHVGASEVPEIEEFLAENRAVRFIDGRVEENVDRVVFCTGFLFSYPFLPSLAPELLTSGKGVHGLYKHLLHIQHPTLVFPGLLMMAVPFPLSESQAAIFAAVWSNALALPPVEEMEEWSRELHQRKGEALHACEKGADGLYINELHDWAMKASPRGREPPYWGDEALWERSIFAEAKIRFEQLGGTAKTLEELGFIYPGRNGHSVSQPETSAVQNPPAPGSGDAA